MAVSKDTSDHKASAQPRRRLVIGLNVVFTVLAAAVEWRSRPNPQRVRQPIRFHRAATEGEVRHVHAERAVFL